MRPGHQMMVVKSLEKKISMKMTQTTTKNRREMAMMSLWLGITRRCTLGKTVRVRKSLTMMIRMGTRTTT